MPLTKPGTVFEKESRMFRSLLALLFTAPSLLIAVTTLFATLGPSGGVARADNFCSTPYNPVINPADFRDRAGLPFAIDNPYFPLIPGTTFTYEGTKGGQAARDIFAVTLDKKPIQGVSTTVVKDNFYLDGKLAE